MKPMKQIKAGKRARGFIPGLMIFFMLTAGIFPGSGELLILEKVVELKLNDAEMELVRASADAVRKSVDGLKL